MLVLWRHTKVGKDENEDENVIDAQRVLDQVAGKEINSLISSLPTPHNRVKPQRERDPDQTPPDGAAQGDGARAAVAKKIDGQSRENPQMKCDPKPDTDRHAALGFHG